jgi:hypothetical protein
MDIQQNEVTINGKAYVLKESIQSQPAEKIDGMEYCIVRTYSAGVFAGYVKEIDGKEVVIVKSRRLWYWKGASELSQVAMEGVKFPNDCKIAMEVPAVRVTEAIEIIPATETARKIIQGVKEWKQ